jgi:hypothetical protein
MRTVVVFIWAALASGTAAAFECTGVTLPSTLVICSDAELMRLADERQEAFHEARTSSSSVRRANELAVVAAAHAGFRKSIYENRGSAAGRVKGSMYAIPKGRYGDISGAP